MVKLTWQRLRSLLVKEGAVPKGAVHRGWRVGKRGRYITVWFYAGFKNGPPPTPEDNHELRSALARIGVKFECIVGVYHVPAQDISLD